MAALRYLIGDFLANGLDDRIFLFHEFPTSFPTSILTAQDEPISVIDLREKVAMMVGPDDIDNQSNGSIRKDGVVICESIEGVEPILHRFQPGRVTRVEVGHAIVRGHPM